MIFLLLKNKLKNVEIFLYKLYCIKIWDLLEFFAVAKLLKHEQIWFDLFDKIGHSQEKQ